MSEYQFILVSSHISSFFFLIFLFSFCLLAKSPQWFFFFLIFFLLEDNCFTILCWFLPSTWISHRYTHFPSVLSLPPISHRSPPPSEVTSTGLSAVSCTRFPGAGCFAHGDVSAPMILSQFTLPPPPTLSTGLFSVSASPQWLWVPFMQETWNNTKA